VLNEHALNDPILLSVRKDDPSVSILMSNHYDLGTFTGSKGKREEIE